MRSTLLFVAATVLVLAAPALAEDPAVRHYDLDVVVKPTEIEVTATLHPAKGASIRELALAPTMKVTSVEVNGVAVHHRHEGSVLSLTKSAKGAPGSLFSKFIMAVLPSVEP